MPIEKNLLFQKIQKWFIRQSLEHAKRTIFISISLTLLVGYGMRFLIIDDDLMKMLPKNLDSRKSWESIQQEFGSTESIYIAFGNKSKSVTGPAVKGAPVKSAPCKYLKTS